MHKILIALAIFFTMAGAAHADPVFAPIFSAIFAGMGFGASTVTFLASIASARVTRLVIRRRDE